jgi:hypothetical protein
MVRYRSEHTLAPIPPIHHMIQRPSILHPHRPGYDGLLLTRPIRYTPPPPTPAQTVRRQTVMSIVPKTVGVTPLPYSTHGGGHTHRYEIARVQHDTGKTVVVLTGDHGLAIDGAPYVAPTGS